MPRSGAFTLAKGSAYKPLRTEHFVSRIGFSQRLELRQSQALVMTPQLQQAIKMLQLSNLELADFVEAEIEQNPLLELGERDADDNPAAESDPVVAEVNRAPVVLAAEPPGLLAGDLAGDTAEPWHAESGTEGDGTNEFGGARGGDAPPWQIRNPGRHDDGFSGIDNAAARPRTLREHLIEQIGADLPDLADRVIAFHLLDQLDEAGYLRSGLDGAAQRLRCPPALVARVPALLPDFDPPRVFPRDLPETL